VAVGGYADIYLILGATPEQVTQKYYTLIGNPVLVPQWGLGWHQCRYGYRSVDTLQSVLEGYQNGNFPLDVMWSDIDYMQNYRNFLYDDQLAFKGLPDFIAKVHGLGMKWVPILDAGTAARPLQEENYPEYLQGEKDGVFMKINVETFIG
jgi:alpha-glucosidase (family GH31 glycosyl hydrolase)